MSHNSSPDSATFFENPRDLRRACREGTFSSQTSGQTPGFAQANLCILPKEYAFDFLLFCQRNPKPCPLIAVLEAGQYIYRGTSSREDTKIYNANGINTDNNIGGYKNDGDDEEDIDIRTDLPRYRVYKDGELIDDKCLSLLGSGEGAEAAVCCWRDDLVTFIIGCSFSFEEAMANAGLSLRHIEEKKNVPMYNTNIPCESAGVFRGNMVVSMRPFTPKDAIKAVEITARYPRVHGSPVHFGNPEDIGIADINKPEYGDPVTIKQGEIPVFWACGVTPQAVVMSSRPSYCITHAPGHMLVLNLRNEELSISSSS